MATPSDPKPPQPDHSMKEETPLGWDQAPKGSEQEKPHRHPRQEGTGGTYDEEKTLEETQVSEDDQPKAMEKDAGGE